LAILAAIGVAIAVAPAGLSQAGASPSAVITQAAQTAQGVSNVVGVVYIAALAPTMGESVADLSTNLNVPPLPSAADAVPIDLPHLGKNNAPFVILARDKVHQDFCQDCSAADAALLASTETPLNLTDFATPIVGTPAWKTVPSWYQISAQDNTISQPVELALLDQDHRRHSRDGLGHRGNAENQL
jgi:hypothetical protein